MQTAEIGLSEKNQKKKPKCAETKCNKHDESMTFQFDLCIWGKLPCGSTQICFGLLSAYGLSSLCVVYIVGFHGTPFCCCINKC